MKKFSFAVPSTHISNLNIPIAWKVFMGIAVLSSVVALSHDGYVFSKYGLGWQKELEIPDVVVQEFQEGELNSVLSLMKEREREFVRLGIEGVKIKNLFPEK